MDVAAELVKLHAAYLPGYTHAVSSSIVDGPIHSLTHVFEKLGRRDDCKVLLIWGTADAVIPYRYSPKMRELIPTAELVTVPGGSHYLPLTHTDLLADEISRWFEKVAS